MTETLHCPAPDFERLDDILIRTEVGSTAHGTGLGGHEDYDEMGIYAPRWDEWIGFPDKGVDTIIYRPGRGPTDPSMPGDYDLTLHTAKKFVGLAAKGNPSILGAMFGPVQYLHPCGLGQDLLDIRMAFWHEGARNSFLGYAQAQRERMQGTRGAAGRVRRNPDGDGSVDWKYAMHMVRLGVQGIEYMKWGSMTMPMMPHTRELLIRIRKGELPLEQVISIAEHNENMLKTMGSDAPDEPGWAAINKWLAKVYEFSRDG